MIDNYSDSRQLQRSTQEEEDVSQLVQIVRIVELRKIVLNINY